MLRGLLFPLAAGLVFMSLTALAAVSDFTGEFANANWTAGTQSCVRTADSAAYDKLIDQASAANKGATFVKVADASDTAGSSITYSPGASEQGPWRVAIIKNWYGVISGGVEAGGVATGTADTGPPATGMPDPGSFDPSWGTVDTYWRAVTATDDGRTSVTAFPTGYDILPNADSSSGSIGAAMGAGGLQSTVASVDPDTFTLDRSVDWVAWVVAVRPEAAVARSAALAATADLASAPQRDLLRAVLLPATAALAASGYTIRAAAASVSATAEIASVGAHVAERTSGLSATAAIASVGEHIAERTSALSAEADIASVGQVESGGAAVERSASLDATADISSDGARHSRYQVRNLVAVAVSTSEIDLTWDAMTLLSPVAYDIERDSVVIVRDHPDEFYNDTGLDADTGYVYRVRAVA